MKLFIARSFFVKNEYRDMRIDEEGIFNSFDMALKFVNKMKCKDESDSFRIEIVSYILNSLHPWEKTEEYYYDKSGKFIRKHPSTSCETDETTTYTGKYNVGDIVYIRAYPFNEHSHMAIDIIGVVSWRPKLYKDWVAEGKPEDDWNCEYTVDFISTEGYLTHEHIKEKGLKLWLDELPDELQFLGRLSVHYMGEEPIDRDILEDLLSSKFFVKNVRRHPTLS